MAGISRSRRASRIARAIAVVLVIAVTPDLGHALWSATSNSGAGGDGHAATLPAGNQPSGSATGLTVDLTWSATLLPDGGPVAGYEVFAYNANTGASRAVGGSCAGIVSSASCADTGVPEGKWQYSVRPRQYLWSGPEGLQSATITVDTTGPVVTMIQPTEGTYYRNSTWNAGCVAGRGLCGTAVDLYSTVADIKLSVRQASTGNYWDGSAFTSVTEVLLPATGTTSWFFFMPANRFPAEGQYTSRVVATDSLGNVSSTPTTFFFDRTNPTVTVVFPVTGTTYGPLNWSTGCVGGDICGTASDTLGVVEVTVSVRRGAGNYWDGAAFASAIPVQLPVTGTTSWELAFPLTNFPANGNYRIWATVTDNAGRTSSNQQVPTIDITDPATINLRLVNGGGIPGRGMINPTADSLWIRYSETLAVGSICSTWSGDGSDQTLSGPGVLVTVTDNGADDILTVASTDCTLNVGPLNLGGDYVTATAVFGGTAPSDSTVFWDVSAQRLFVTIGALVSGTLNTTTQPRGTVVYVPAAPITDPYGNPIDTTPFTKLLERF